jgi:hypothetical protein
MLMMTSISLLQKQFVGIHNGNAASYTMSIFCIQCIQAKGKMHLLSGYFFLSWPKKEAAGRLPANGLLLQLKFPRATPR